MIKQLAGWKGRVSVNGKEYKCISEVPDDVLTDTTIITLIPDFARQSIKRVDSDVEHVITVKEYMTKPATLEFDFMDKWNKGVPMPMRTMAGTILEETKGMVKMKLHGYGKPAIHCVRCGRELTNPISRHYGLGIECIQKVGIFRDINDVEGIKEDLVKMEWTGWIIRSAILDDKIEGC